MLSGQLVEASRLPFVIAAIRRPFLLIVLGPGWVALPSPRNAVTSTGWDSPSVSFHTSIRADTECADACVCSEEWLCSFAVDLLLLAEAL